MKTTNSSPIRNLNLLRFLFIFVACAWATPSFAQIQGSSQNEDTFRGLPVVHLDDSVAIKLLSDEKRKDLKRALERRSNALEFFKMMRQLAEPSTISFFGTDKTWYTDSKYQKKLFLLNGDLQTPIALGGRRWTIKDKVFWGKRTLMNTLHIVPRFKVRIFKDDFAKFRDTSSSVRTPSYLPAITWYLANEKKWKQEKDKPGRKKYTASRFFGIKLFHHSNGQDGDEFNLNGTVNFYNGNFGENLVPEFIIGGIREYDARPFFLFKKRKSEKQPDAKTAPGKAKRLFYWKASLEPHFKEVFGIPLTNAVFDSLDLYGRYRVNLQLAWSVIPRYRELIRSGDCYIQVTEGEERELFRLLLDFSFIADPKYNTGDRNKRKRVKWFGLDKRMNLYATLFWRITGAPNASLFAQFGYWGSDPYNIYFQQSLFQLRGGISMAFYKFPDSGDLKLPDLSK